MMEATNPLKGSDFTFCCNQLSSITAWKGGFCAVCSMVMAVIGQLRSLGN